MNIKDKYRPLIKFVLYNRHKNKVLPRIYDLRSEARRRSKLHKGYSVVKVSDLPPYVKLFNKIIKT